MFRHFDDEVKSKESKKDLKPEKATVATVRSESKLRCVSYDVEMPEQTRDLQT